MTHRMRRVVPLVMGVLLACAGAAVAQETGSRSEEHARQQEQKARNLSHYKRTILERRILSAEQGGGFGMPRGLFVTFGDIKRGSGIALGPAYGRVLSNGTRVWAKTTYSVHQYKLAQVNAVSAPLFARRVSIGGRVRWQDAPSVHLYALGPDSPPTRTAYAESKTEASVHTLFTPIPLLRFGGGVSFESYTTGVAHSLDPGLALFAVPGMGADPTYLHSHVSAAIDSRDSEGYSRHGSLLRGTLHDYHQRGDGPFTFQRVDGDAEQYLPILHGNWVLFLAAHASTTTQANGRSVPFFLMPDLGGHDLRGFGNYRFRDRHSIYMTAEYRWYAQEYLDAAIFYDAGKVVPDRSALNFSGLKHSIGAALRLHGPQTSALRFEVAHSREGTRILVGVSAVGQ
jgi:hypothetical protein